VPTLEIPLIDNAVPTILLTFIFGDPVKPPEVPEVFWFSVGILAASKVPEVILLDAKFGI